MYIPLVIQHEVIQSMEAMTDSSDELMLVIRSLPREERESDHEKMP
jgi:hypothetical protein